MIVFWCSIINEIDGIDLLLLINFQERIKILIRILFLYKVTNDNGNSLERSSQFKLILK